MAQPAAVESYLQTLEFKKKSFGGCDEEDALAKMHELAALYQEEVDRLERKVKAAEQRAADYENRQAEVRQLMTAAQNMKDTMLAKAEEESKQVIARAEREAQRLIDRASADAENIAARAAAESIVVVSEARDEASRMRSEARQEAECAQRELQETTEALLEAQMEVKAAVKRHTDTAYAKAKVANDNLGQIVEMLADLRESVSS